MPDRIAQLFADVLFLPPEEISDATSPANTPEWDSLASINLTVAIEQEFAVKLKIQEVVAMNSVAAVKAVLRQKGVAGMEASAS